MGASLSQNDYVAQWALRQQTWVKHKDNFFLNKIYGYKIEVLFNRGQKNMFLMILKFTFKFHMLVKSTE